MTGLRHAQELMPFCPAGILSRPPLAFSGSPYFLSLILSLPRGQLTHMPRWFTVCWGSCRARHWAHPPAGRGPRLLVGVQLPCTSFRFPWSPSCQISNSEERPAGIWEPAGGQLHPSVLRRRCPGCHGPGAALDIHDGAGVAFRPRSPSHS